MPKVNWNDTIAARSTPPGVGGIAVIRVSGKDAVSLVTKFFRPTQKTDLDAAPTHTIHHGCWVDEKGEVLDEVLVSLFRSPRSYTGEDVAEISCHGGPHPTRRILEALVSAGARHAGPGEFTQRAFLKGKMDLTQAEAVLDLIRSQSDVSMAAALRQLQGRLSKKLQGLKEDLLKLCAHFESSLDFPDEHLEHFSAEEFSKRMRAAEGEIQKLVASFKRGLWMREGILTVIVGRPNVGKSSLLNALLEKDRALVSEIPGTTRDTLEETIEIGGWALRLVDTAGLNPAPKDELDRMGIERTQATLQEADLLLLLFDGSSPWTSEDAVLCSRLQGKNILPVINKADLPRKLSVEKLNGSILGHPPCVISCATGTGLPELEKRIEEKILENGRVEESMVLTRLRHKQALEKGLEGLRRARKSFEEKLSAEFILVDLKAAVDSLRELVGEVYSEDLLDVIFQEFCIGK
ncbi:MAG: tRNA uridine-5-carboxymethylaminomethyl(34) synthesis GTPase MnmE [Candidatus Omnitrophica bacterium]|nr:tRNA uridine-5-carboxymethylaminomethyl(34) synthesis GTPase MnmE [Candidatus Omnitrophota bacterium]